MSLSRYGPQLWTRERAREIRRHVMDLVQYLGNGDVFVFDFAGIKAFDFSFAKELFGGILTELRNENNSRFIVLENLTEYTRENLDTALQGLGLALIERAGDTVTLLGKVKRVDRETFDTVMRLTMPVTALQLSKALGIRITAVNERLRKLVGAGLVRSERGVSQAGREQFIYYVLR